MCVKLPREILCSGVWQKGFAKMTLKSRGEAVIGLRKAEGEQEDGTH